jgi:hypothetical protein
VRDNKEISKILGTMWANASEKEKSPFIEKELKLRAEYNNKIAQWRSERNELIEKERKEREAAVQGAIDNGTSEELIKAARVAQKAAQGLPKAPPKIVCTTPTLNTIGTEHLSHDCSSLNSHESHNKQGLDYVAPHHRLHHTYHHMHNSRQIHLGNPDTPSWNVHPVPVDMPYAGVDANSVPVYHYHHQQYNGNYNAMGSLQAPDRTNNNNVPGYISACDFPNNHLCNFSSFQPFPAEHMCQNNIQMNHFSALHGYNPGFVPVHTGTNTHNRNQGDFSNLQPYAVQDVSGIKIDHPPPNSHCPAPTPNIFNDLNNFGYVPSMQPDHYFSGAPKYHYPQQMYAEQPPSESTIFGARLPQTNPHFPAFPAAPDGTAYTNAWSNQPQIGRNGYAG